MPPLALALLIVAGPAFGATEPKKALPPPEAVYPKQTVPSPPAASPPPAQTPKPPAQPAAAPQPPPAESPKPPAKPAVAPAILEALPPGIAVPILGRKVEGPGKEDMGRVVDVLVDGAGRPLAAVIDFGGFLGVGSRKIAIDWSLLSFSPGDPDAPVALALAPEQVQSAPEYKPPAASAEVVGPADRPPAPPGR